MQRHVATVVNFAAIALTLGCAAPTDRTDTVATAAAAGTLAEPNIAEIRSAISAANEKWVAALLAGDAAAASAHYADDAILMMPMMETWNGRPAIEAGTKALLAEAKITDAKFNIVDILASGDLAVETGTFTMTATAKDGKPVVDKGKYITVWKRQSDGGWKIVRDINNSDPAPPKAK